MSALQSSLQGSNSKVIAGYALQQRLGSGSFATVYKGVRIATDDNDNSADVVAIKAITRLSDKLTKKVLENLEMEIQILRTYRHPHIVCLQEVQKTERHFYLILEYCGGGDLQRLIRTRKTGRLSERLTRRLMRDLSSGLKFLWGQELIHRDIKPQNLLLTGPLPWDEQHDPPQLGITEERSSTPFSLKIADFGFARHLQTASLAETLCGSPLYMAPEILQHHRYDAKADIWSVGTVLFEMIAGRPPFNGENHIDLLRNIQRKAVRLPADVHVSKECINLLRILLNRNPLSRAGFKEFFEACDAFVALGCEGSESASTGNVGTMQPLIKMELGTIREFDQTTTHGAASMMTVATAAPSSHTPRLPPPPPPSSQAMLPNQDGTSFVTPPFGPLPTPTSQMLNPLPESKLTSARAQGQPRFAPLQASPPPFPAPFYYATRLTSGVSSNQGSLLPPASWQQQLHQKSDPAEQASQTSSDDSGFVMVNKSEVFSPEVSGTGSASASGNGNQRTEGVNRFPPYPLMPLQQHPMPSRGDYNFVNEARSIQVPKGMLSTSPGTGGYLVRMMGGRGRLLPQTVSGNLGPGRWDAQIESTSKMVAAAEDVGRRSITVAHLGDSRAYWAMKLVAGGESSSLLSNTQMEGVEEESSDEDSSERSSANVTDYDESDSTENVGGRRCVPDPNQDDEDEDMPFAMPSPKDEALLVSIPTRSNSSSNFLAKSKLIQSKGITKPSAQVIRLHFGEALTCYLKALSMIKSVLSAVQSFKADIEITLSGSMSTEQRANVQSLVKRCDGTCTWLSRQFTCVLERADAANFEINKVPSPCTSNGTGSELPVLSAEELIYNHALACGRDAAVKQLLGQYDAARSCYRSAGLLAETLLMEPSIGAEDRKVLEGYVDGFATRIKEVDDIMLQQSRNIVNSPGSSVSKRGSAVIGLIGGIAPPKNEGCYPAFQLSATDM